MAGGEVMNTCASGTLAIARVNRAAMVSASSLRSSQSFSRMKAWPTFWPLPVTLKPAVAWIESTPSSFTATALRRSITARVCSSVEPAGSFTSALSMPWSSSGRNAPGRCHSNRPVATLSTR